MRWRDKSNDPSWDPRPVTLGQWWVFVAFGISLFSIITLPSWLFASMGRGCLWRLRDELFDARTDGLLSDVPHIDELIGQMEMFIVVAPQTTALQVWWLRHRWRDQKGKWERIQAVELPSRERALFEWYQSEMIRLIARIYMTGSWSGLALVSTRNPQRFWEVCRPRRGPGGYGDKTPVEPIPSPVQGGPSATTAEERIVSEVDRAASIRPTRDRESELVSVGVAGD